MRIAVSGTHVVGKSTLVESLGERLPDHTIVPEPYELLEERGYVFEHPPSVDDYVAQLRESLAVLRSPAPNLIVDRSPLDVLSYIFAAGAEPFELETWSGAISDALASLDLAVVLRVDPEHDPVAPDDDMAFRCAVDGWLQDIMDDDRFDFLEGVDILTLGGPWHRRVTSVLAHLKAMDHQQTGVARS